MKLQELKNRIELLNKLIIITATLFVMLSFVTFYMVTVLELEELYGNIAKGMLIINFMSIMISNYLLKQEEKRMKNLIIIH